MKKPQMKKRRGAWLVYIDKKHAFKCYNKHAARIAFRVLSLAK